VEPGEVGQTSERRVTVVYTRVSIRAQTSRFRASCRVYDWACGAIELDEKHVDVTLAMCWCILQWTFE